MSDTTSLQIVQRAYAAFKTGDIQTLLGQFSNDVSWNLPSIENVRVSGSRTGKAKVAEFFSMLAEDQETLMFEPKQFVPDGNLVITLGQYRWRVKGTGREISSDFAHVFTVDRGQIVRFQEFMDTAAFAAAYAGALSAV